MPSEEPPNTEDTEAFSRPFRAASRKRSCLAYADTIISALRSVGTTDGLLELMEAITRELGCRYFALIHHDDLRVPRADRVDLKRYPSAIAERLIGQGGYRRDPVIRACNYSGGAFVWSDLGEIIRIDRKDHASLDFGARQGLNQGITVPYIRLGESLGSCTFAGERCLARDPGNIDGDRSTYQAGQSQPSPRESPVSCGTSSARGKPRRDNGAVDRRLSRRRAGLSLQ